MEFTVLRVFRTPSSERFILASDGKDFAALELHFHITGKVDGTLTIFQDANFPEDQIPALLEKIDDQLLPDVSTEEESLTFTVVIGKVLGAFTSEKK